MLDDSLPKYLNTSETDIFKKGELLYGLEIAKTAIRASGEALVVEGYMDVIALHQTGFDTAVAALGATLTADQAAQLSRLDVQKLYLAFDADEAGQRAILSGLEQSVGRQFLVRAVRVPHGKDPADAVLGGHVAEFRAALSEGLSEGRISLHQHPRQVRPQHLGRQKGHSKRPVAGVAPARRVRPRRRRDAPTGHRQT